jgi:nicotinate-nucleotide adenylyltransferase
MQRIGILGGTFDPPHIGHLVLAEYAAEALDFSQVIFVPAADPPHKRGETRTPIEHRIAMLQLAIAGNTRFTWSRVDVDRPGPHYTVDMIRILQAEHTDADLYFVMGGDSLRDLPKWNRPDELLNESKLVVLQRPNMETVSADMHETRFPGSSERIIILNDPLLGFSSTGIVERLREGKSIRYMTPDSVLVYIHDQELYRT